MSRHWDVETYVDEEDTPAARQGVLNSVELSQLREILSQEKPQPELAFKKPNTASQEFFGSLLGNVTKPLGYAAGMAKKAMGMPSDTSLSDVPVAQILNSIMMLHPRSRMMGMASSLGGAGGAAIGGQGSGMELLGSALGGMFGTKPLETVIGKMAPSWIKALLGGTAAAGAAGEAGLGTKVKDLAGKGAAVDDAVLASTKAPVDGIMGMTPSKGPSAREIDRFIAAAERGARKSRYQAAFANRGLGRDLSGLDAESKTLWNMIQSDHPELLLTDQSVDELVQKVYPLLAKGNDAATAYKSLFGSTARTLAPQGFERVRAARAAEGKAATAQATAPTQEFSKFADEVQKVAGAMDPVEVDKLMAQGAELAKKGMKFEDIYKIAFGRELPGAPPFRQRVQ